MSLTLDQLLQCEDRLNAEIAERECLLAAINVLKGYAEKGKTLRAVELGALGKALLGEERPGTLLLESTPETPTRPPAVPVVPALPRPKPYIHPELEPFQRRHGGHTEAVVWAIQRMTDDYSIRDILALLRREGYPIKGAQISVVLTRMRGRDQLVEVKGSYGPMGAVYRRPENPILMAEAAADVMASSAAA